MDIPVLDVSSAGPQGVPGIIVAERRGGARPDDRPVYVVRALSMCARILRSQDAIAPSACADHARIRDPPDGSEERC